MILVDTSAWLKHFRSRNPIVEEGLEQDAVFIHPFVLLELILGNIGRNQDILRNLKNLRPVPELTHEEVVFFVNKHKLGGSGIGAVDSHILASAVLMGAELVTFDKKLRSVWERLV